MTPEQAKTFALLTSANVACDLAANEFNVIHAICDRAEVPRFQDGEKLTASQRVTALEMAYRDIRYLYRGEAPPLPGSDTH